MSGMPKKKRKAEVLFREVVGWKVLQQVVRDEQVLQDSVLVGDHLEVGHVFLFCLSGHAIQPEHM